MASLLSTNHAVHGAENKMVAVQYTYCPLGGVVMTANGVLGLQFSAVLFVLHIHTSVEKYSCK